MDTHSVELDQDMSKITILVDDQGNEYKSLRWEGTPAGGHHREGALVFERIKSNSNSIELKIFSIGDVVRSFLGKLNKYMNNHNTQEIIYTCPMHPEVRQDRQGMCPSAEWRLCR